MENKANQLLDKNYMLGFLRENILPLYPYFSGIKSLRVIPHKDHVWEGGTYHVVIEYRTRFYDENGKITSLPIFCSAHSSEPRRNIYDSLSFLWQYRFSTGYLSIPHPLMYSEYFRGTFYRGVVGHHLYYYIKRNDREVIDAIVPKVAKWFVKLHKINVRGVRNFNHENSRIETAFPGFPHIFMRIEQKYPDHLDRYKRILPRINKKEKEFFRDQEKRWLIHGDAHPENVIKMGKKKIALIDFTDICLSDFTRDVGTFAQQLEYMANRKIKDAKYAEKICKAFIEAYFSLSPEKLTQDVKERIDNYYYWTAMRTATMFLLKGDPEPERAWPLIDRVEEGLFG